ncbi:hypothetical protein [Hoeflea alexandrii]|uniref:Uncharacterized protein n=1 Tax=Hoeflea alexandrii TaxID=288436 RepID=A0ABT1CMA9_9HYPH|nr:hypothetical protein [Hoeflea alexandrii]MCO6407344.1 hypothetical protein [Hoeflea alexandrii]MCY0154259.1 hypothetical protein [Hoeflea alexandrii]
MAIARIPLSKIARDPIVAAFLARGERDNGMEYAVPAAPKPVLPNGAARVLVAA